MSANPDIRKKSSLAIVLIAGAVTLFCSGYTIRQVMFDSMWGGISSQKLTGLAAYAGLARAGSPNWQSGSGESDIVRAAILELETLDFDRGVAAVSEVARKSGGYIEALQINRAVDAPRELVATLRLPADSLDPALATLKGLGTVQQETESSENTRVEKESLHSELESKRAELARLEEIVRGRKGSLSDVLQAEEKLAQYRADIKTLDKKKKRLDSRLEYARLQVTLTEEFRARLAFNSAAKLRNLRNSLVGGVDAVLTSLALCLGFLLHFGLPAALWGVLLYWPSRKIWRKWRTASALAPAAGLPGATT